MYFSPLTYLLSMTDCLLTATSALRACCLSFNARQTALLGFLCLRTALVDVSIDNIFEKPFQSIASVRC